MTESSCPRTPSWAPTVLAWACTLLVSSVAATGHASALSPLSRMEAAQAQAMAPEWTFHTQKGEQLRVSLLTDSLFRVQASSDARFSGPGNGQASIVESEPRQAVAHQFTDEGSHHLLRTAKMALRIYKSPLRLALYRADNHTLLWQETQSLNLGAKRSVQTLSSTPDERFFGGGQQNGRFEFKGRELPISYSGGWEEGDRPNPAPFFMSSRGWGMLRHSWAPGSYDFRQADQLSTAHDEARFDAYYFVGDTFREVLDGYTALTGRARMLPRWAYEYGDADCYNDGDNIKKPGTMPNGWSDGPTGKTPDVVASVARKYREHDMPGGWILPNDGYGCGYTDLPGVVKSLADLGFRTGLWTEDGVDKIAWEVGQAGSRAQKLDVAWTGKGYQHSLDANHAAHQGILNHSDARPFVWTVMGWAGTQRYAVTWTGDQSGSWDYIRWHIPTLIGSGLSGQAYATGDVDGIFGGSPETFTRDLQWKAFTPVLMGMSGWSSHVRKHPWWFDEPYRSLNRDALKLKMRLTPYMMGLAREAELRGAPPVRGLMWDHPQDPHAFSEAHKYQFFLGRDFLVAPVYRSQAATQGWRRGIYLPQGVWYDYFDGRRASAGAQGRTLDMKVGLEKLPVFVRAGAIIPMQPPMLFDGEKPRDELTLDIYPHGHSHTTVYEDDGLTRAYQRGAFSEQRIEVKAPDATSGQPGPITISVQAAHGHYQGQLEQRRTRLMLRTRSAVSGVTLGGQTVPAVASLAALDALEPQASGWVYQSDERGGTLHVRSARHDIRQALNWVVQPGDVGMDVREGDFPAAPELGRAVPPDSLLVINRPLEESGHMLENAFDDKPQTWFRSSRNQAIKTGPVEFVVSLGERRLIDGLEFAPRTDQHWKYGQVGEFEVYLGDNNGDWGAPAYRGVLQHSKDAQTVNFAAKAGKLLRLRILSSLNPNTGQAGLNTDPMVLAVSAAAKPAQGQGNGSVAMPRAYSATAHAGPEPITLSSLRILQQLPPAGEPRSLELAQLQGLGTVAVNRPAGHKQAGLRMNALAFRHGLSMKPGQSVKLALKGYWETLKADLGIDDQCRSPQAGVHFQVWGDARLLYDSGAVQDAAVVKPEIDLRGLSTLELRTLALPGRSVTGVCGNWANATLTGGPDSQAHPSR